jgi:hypothetical protein
LLRPFNDLHDHTDLWLRIPASIATQGRIGTGEDIMSVYSGTIPGLGLPVIRCRLSLVRSLFAGTALWLSALLASSSVQAGMLYSASLKNGSYGGGFIVDTFTSTSDPDGSSAGDGNLSNIGIVNTAAGVNYTANNAVINYSIGRDFGGAMQTSFRTHGTVSVRFKASLQDHVGGQPFTDNYGFNQFNSGQGTFGTAMSRSIGTDGLAKTADDRVSIGWSTWHLGISGNWRNHVAAPILLTYDDWHYLGFTWDGAAKKFEIWVDGVLRAADMLPSGATGSWGASWLGLGSAYNFALGEIHERAFGNSSTYGVTFSDLTIWDEYRTLGGTQAPQVIPEPSTGFLLGIGSLLFGQWSWRRRHRQRP